LLMKITKSAAEKLTFFARVLITWIKGKYVIVLSINAIINLKSSESSLRGGAEANKN